MVRGAGVCTCLCLRVPACLYVWALGFFKPGMKVFLSVSREPEKATRGIFFFFPQAPTLALALANGPPRAGLMMCSGDDDDDSYISSALSHASTGFQGSGKGRRCL